MGNLLWALRFGIFGAGALVLLGTGVAIASLGLSFNLFWVVLIGLVVGQIIGTATDDARNAMGFRVMENIMSHHETGRVIDEVSA